MNWRRSLRLSLHALGRARLRTALSASGMAIGIAAVVMLFGIGGGAERAFQEALEGMGKNLLSVSAELQQSNALRGNGRQVETLVLADWRAIIDDLDCVQRAAPIAIRQLALRRGERTLSTTVIGTTPAFQHTNQQMLAAGRFLDEGDVADRGRVAVIGAHVVRELFFGEQPLGERLQVAGMPFIVVGVLQEKGVDPTGADEDNRILIPILTAQRRLLDMDHIDRIFVQAVSKPALGKAEDGVRALLRSRHGREDFTVRNQAVLLRALAASDRTFSRLLAGLAALTLSLASVGLLAVSLLSVRERHGEIGLRLTVGALPRHVLYQFLSESVMVAVLGAAGGLLAGGGGIILGEKLLGWRLALTWQAVIYPFLLALAISIVFGAYPARRAAKLDPIVALRSG